VSGLTRPFSSVTIKKTTNINIGMISKIYVVDPNHEDIELVDDHFILYKGEELIDGAFDCCSTEIMILAEEHFGEEYYIDLEAFEFRIHEFPQTSTDDEVEYYSGIAGEIRSISSKLFGAPFKVIEVDVTDYI
jgi:hypothetical protein